MPVSKLLIANRGEIAIRVARAAAGLGVHSVAVYPEDDARSLHVKKADEARLLPGRGALAYLDTDAVVEAAVASSCDALHPGYGFLSESAGLARACAQAGITFVGPSPGALDELGDKARARALAEACGVPILAGTEGPASLDDARAFLASLGPGRSAFIKAIAGGGGRGMRPVEREDQLEEALERCRSEAEKAFGRGDVYLEERIEQARHVEVQIVGDGESISHVWERECTLQRRHQKLVEVAPRPPRRAPPRPPRGSATPCASSCSTPRSRWRSGSATRGWAPSSSCSTPTTPSASSSSRPTRACKSSTRSPRR